MYAQLSVASTRLNEIGFLLTESLFQHYCFNLKDTMRERQEGLEARTVCQRNVLSAKELLGSHVEEGDLPDHDG